jgi:hypothetical protein
VKPDEGGDEEVTQETRVPGAGDTSTVSLRLSAGGTASAATAPQPFVDAVAYAAQMGDIIGELWDSRVSYGWRWPSLQAAA